MPKGPQGQKRPADVIRNIVQVMRIATGQEEEVSPSKKSAASKESGKKGGKSRAKKMTPEERRASATKAAKARWKSS